MLAVIGYNVWTLCCDLIMKWKKLCVDDSVALTGGCYTFVSKWTYMCMLWKFTPCFHDIIWLKWGHFFIILKVHSVTKTLSKHTNIQVCLATGWWCYLFIHLSFAFINYIFIVSFCLSGYFKPLDRVQIKSP